MDKNIGKMLDGRYEITQSIGVGGMADVYSGFDHTEKRVVAIKILKKEYAESDEFVKRFRNESKAVSVMSHPNIVKIYDVNFSERSPYIVMEYIDGETLKQHMEKEGPLGWKEAVHIMIQTLRALQHTHDKGIFHRDIKPHNIMLLKDGTVKVMDFGIAKFARDKGGTATDQAIGSVHYISPEQAQGKAVDTRSDIYSVGVVLYEMMTGTKPFDTENPVSVAVMHMQEPARYPREINPDILSGMEEIILKAMEKVAKNRYQTTASMIRDLEALKNNPDVVFGYFKARSENAKPEEGGFSDATRYFGTGTGQAISKNKSATAVKKKNPKEENMYRSELNEEELDDEYVDDYDDDGYDGGYDEEYDEYDEYDEDGEYYDDDEQKSPFMPILVAVTLVVVLVAVFFIVKMIVGNGSGGGPDKYVVREYIGMTFDDAQAEATWLRFKLEGEPEYSDHEPDTIIYQSLEQGTKAKKGTEILVRISKGRETEYVPNVKNYTEAQGLAALEAKGFNVTVKPYDDSNLSPGMVVMTEPGAGSELPRGSEVLMYVSTGMKDGEVVVPALTNMPYDQAAAMAVASKLLPVQQPVDSAEPAGTVVEQSLEAATSVAPNTVITLSVSTGNAPVAKVPLTFDLPAGATGQYTITVMLNGVVIANSATINAAFTTRATVDVEYSGTHDVVAVLYNVSNGLSAKIGQYRMNFTEKTVQVLAHDMNAAWAAVGDKPVTVPPVTQPPIITTPKPPETTVAAEQPPENQ